MLDLRKGKWSKLNCIAFLEGWSGSQCSKTSNLYDQSWNSNTRMPNSCNLSSSSVLHKNPDGNMWQYADFWIFFGKFSFKSTPISFCQKKLFPPCWPRVPGHRMPPHHSCCAVFAPLPFFSGIHLVPPIASKNITHSIPNILAVCKIVWTNVVVFFCLFQFMGRILKVFYE